MAKVTGWGSGYLDMRGHKTTHVYYIKYSLDDDKRALESVMSLSDDILD